MYISLSSLRVWILSLAMSNNYNPQVRHPALTDDMAARAGLSVQCKFCQSVKKIKNVHNQSYQLSYLTEPVSVPPVTSFSPPEASPTVLEGGSYNVTCVVSANPPTQVLLSSSHHHHHLSQPNDCQAIPLFPQIPARGPTPQMSPGFCLFNLFLPLPLLP